MKRKLKKLSIEKKAEQQKAEKLASKNQELKRSCTRKNNEVISSRISRSHTFLIGRVWVKSNTTCFIVVF